MNKLVPILALTAMAALVPTQKAEARWGCWGGGFRCGPRFGIGIGIPLFAPGPYYYGRPYYARPYQYSRGSVAANVQVALANKGYYRGSIDGVIGPMSRSAIRSYQSRHHLPVTGSIDRSLLHSLRLG